MNYLTKRILTSIMLIFIVYLSLSNLILLFLLLIILNLLAISEFNLIFKNIFKHNKFLIFSSVFFSVFYLTLFSVIIWIHLLSLEYTQIISLVLILTICVSSDIGGFVFDPLEHLRRRSREVAFIEHVRARQHHRARRQLLIIGDQ